MNYTAKKRRGSVGSRIENGLLCCSKALLTWEMIRGGWSEKALLTWEMIRGGWSEHLRRQRLTIEVRRECAQHGIVRSQPPGHRSGLHGLYTDDAETRGEFLTRDVGRSATFFFVTSTDC